MAKPFGGNGPPAALFHDSRDRGGTHPRGHPAGWRGILQADAYAGFNGLYAKGRAPAPLTEASCWAQGGARFFELADLAKAMRAPMAIEAVRRIDGNRRRPWSSPDAYYPLTGRLEAGMVICIESYVGSATSGQGVKLEDQFLIHEDRVERLSTYPFDARLG